MRILDWICSKVCKKSAVAIQATAPTLDFETPPVKRKTRDCMSCKWSNQGESHSACFNPNQIPERFKGYCYYGFICDLHEFGDRLSDRQMRQLGYKKKTKTSIMWDNSKHTLKYWE